ncbi:Homeobox KN domain [Carpediemonas membranifera]|uniref:Homeobox KN domain n=1 Tax=Carpediemonas membranifera TaxID=201153 RepID=A0A8J6AVE4_9EUKA|nr:Homeobox KN domain [Carpediemonas membranifera]|eukprot:KAG9395761.1 Homeobox KN domain [Carpediemonas membranifera]
MPRYPDKQSRVIAEWFQAHLFSPYPSEDDYQALSHETGIPRDKLYNAIAQKRKRLRHSSREVFRKNVIGSATDPCTLRRPARGTLEEWSAFLVCAQQYLWRESDKPSVEFDVRYVEQMARLMFREE